MEENNNINNDEETSKETKDANINNDVNSSYKPSLKNMAKNVLDATSDNRYRSRKNLFNSNEDDKTPKASTMPNKKNNSIISNAKNKIANKIVNKATDTIPGLKAASTAANAVNAVKNIAGKRQNNLSNSVSNSSDDENNKQDSSSLNNNNNDNNESKLPSNTDAIDNNETENSFNPASSIFNLTNNFLGNFSFFGKLPPIVKFSLTGIALLLVSLIFIVFPMLAVLSFFSGLLGTSKVVAAGGSSGSLDYVLSSDGDSFLHESLDTFLASNGTSIEEFNKLISSNVEDVGYGTREGVVAAAVTLIAELGNTYEVKLPYFWGGGHGEMISGAASNWGSNQCHATAFGNNYNYCGLDCSGFVAWAIYNGGFMIAARTAGNFQNLPEAESVSLTGSAVLQPGDLLESNGHVILVVDIDEEAGEYVCAEASGIESGVTFSRKSFNASGYWGVNMEGFYNREGQVRS